MDRKQAIESVETLVSEVKRLSSPPESVYDGLNAVIEAMDKPKGADLVRIMHHNQERIYALEDIVRHLWVHADLAYSRNQMTSEQRQLFEEVINRGIEDDH